MTPLELLRDTRLSSGCVEDDLICLSEIAQERRFTRNELIFTQSDEADELMVVASGKIQLEIPVSILGELRTIAFETKGYGEVVGWSALVPPHEFTLSARAIEPTTVAAFPRSELMMLFTSDPGVGFRIMKNIAAIVGNRLHHTRAMWGREIQRSLDERYR